MLGSQGMESEFEAYVIMINVSCSSVETDKPANFLSAFHNVPTALWILMFCISLQEEPNVKNKSNPALTQPNYMYKQTENQHHGNKAKYKYSDG